LRHQFEGGLCRPGNCPTTIHELRVNYCAAHEAVDDNGTAMELAAVECAPIEVNVGIGENLVVCNQAVPRFAVNWK
jgi:hypothetical protein